MTGAHRYLPKYSPVALESKSHVSSIEDEKYESDFNRKAHITSIIFIINHRPIVPRERTARRAADMIMIFPRNSSLT